MSGIDMHADFVAHRSLLFTVAYEMLGSAADAEDVVQETWLRWADVGDVARAELQDPRAYLIRIVTRLALNRLRTLARRREEYVGDWLPEPLLTAPDVSADVELAESLSFAMLTVLETLGPTERAVFVLREVFDVPYDEIALAIGKKPAAVRQIARRARVHVAERRPRIRLDRARQERVLQRFLGALTSGDLQGLIDVLAPDVTVIADGGGLASAIRRPVAGPEHVARLLTGFARFAPDVAIRTIWLNGSLAIRVDGRGHVGTTAIMFELAEDGRILRIFAIRNPSKLTRLDEPARVGRSPVPAVKHS